MAQPSRVAIALTSLFGGASGGSAIGTVGAWVANWMNLNGKTTFGDPRNVFVAGVVFGILVGSVLAWKMSEGLEETWRRAAITFTAGAGALGGGMGAYALSLLGIMSFTMIGQFYVPGFCVVLIIVFVVSWRVSMQQRRLMPSAPARRTA